MATSFDTLTASHIKIFSNVFDFGVLSNVFGCKSLFYGLGPTIPLVCKTNSKPSTRFPLGRLVEQSSETNTER